MNLPPLPYVTWDFPAEQHVFKAEDRHRAMVAAYIEASFFFDKPEEENWGGCDLSPEAQNLAEFECAAFLMLAKWHVKDWMMDQIGHDFWLTRNGHGAGFWDRNFGTEESRKALTELSEVFGSRDIYKGDDGQIYYA